MKGQGLLCRILIRLSNTEEETRSRSQSVLFYSENLFWESIKIEKDCSNGRSLFPYWILRSVIQEFCSVVPFTTSTSDTPLMYLWNCIKWLIIQQSLHQQSMLRTTKLQGGIYSAKFSDLKPFLALVTASQGFWRLSPVFHEAVKQQQFKLHPGECSFWRSAVEQAGTAEGSQYRCCKL